MTIHLSNVTVLPTADSPHAREIAGTAIRALTAVLTARDAYTGLHSRRVGDLARKLAAELHLSGLEADELVRAAQLHDIGKLAVPDAVLLKDGPLTDLEAAILRAHPEMGEQLVTSIPVLANLAPLIRAAHERWDGNGYPDGLARDEIPAPSRIVHVCDAYHAMVSPRPYREPLTAGEAVAELERHAGTQFCPTSVAAFVSFAAAPLAA